MDSRGISFFLVFISFVLYATRLYAQDTIVLEAIECAVVKFHLNDDCPCSYFTLENLKGQAENEHFILVSIDSVILIHVADDFIRKDYLINDIRYLFLSDTIELHGDTTYIASIGLQYNMNYIILVELYDENDVYLEIPNGRLGDFGRRPEPEESQAGFDNWNRIKNSIDECDTKYGLKKMVRNESFYVISACALTSTAISCRGGFHVDLAVSCVGFENPKGESNTRKNQIMTMMNPLQNTTRI